MSDLAPAPRSTVIDPVRHAGLSTFQRVLLTTDGSVSELLSLHAGRPIRAQVLHQSISQDTNIAREIGAGALEQLLHRVVLLGCEGEAPMVYASSVFNFSLFSATIQEALLAGKTPIGLLWRRERLEMYREVLEARMEHDDEVSRWLGAGEGDALYSRTYAVYHAGRQLGVVTEKFQVAALR